MNERCSRKKIIFFFTKDCASVNEFQLVETEIEIKIEHKKNNKNETQTDRSAKTCAPKFVNQMKCKAFVCFVSVSQIYDILRPINRINTDKKTLWFILVETIKT